MWMAEWDSSNRLKLAGGPGFQRIVLGGNTPPENTTAAHRQPVTTERVVRVPRPQGLVGRGWGKA
jgi:hypothetical protein